jgi:hypothetical protein
MQRLQDIFNRMGTPGKRIFTFDCKLYTNSPDHQTYHSQFANAVIKLARDYGLVNSVFIESTDTSFLRMIKQREPALRLFIYSTFDSGLVIAEKMGLYGITIANDQVTKEQVKLAHSKRIKITLFGWPPTRKTSMR